MTLLTESDRELAWSRLLTGLPPAGPMFDDVLRVRIGILNSLTDDTVGSLTSDMNECTTEEERYSIAEQVNLIIDVILPRYKVALGFAYRMYMCDKALSAKQIDKLLHDTVEGILAGVYKVTLSVTDHLDDKVNEAVDAMIDEVKAFADDAREVQFLFTRNP